MLRARAGRLRLAQRVWQARSSTFLRRVHSDASKVKIVSGAGSTGKTTHGVQTVVDFLTETTLPTRKAPTNSFAGTDVLILSATESLSYDTSHKVLEHISLTDAARCEFATPSSFTDQVIQLASAASGVTSLRAVDAAQSLVNVKTHLSSLPLSAESSTEVSYQPRPNHEDSFVTAFLKYYQELHSWGVRQSGHAQSDEVPEHQTLSCVAASALLSNDAFCQTEHAGLHLPLLRSAKMLASLRLENDAVYQRGSQEAAALAVQMLHSGGGGLRLVEEEMDRFGLVVIDDAHTWSAVQVQLLQRALSSGPHVRVLLNPSQARHVTDPVMCWSSQFTNDAPDPDISGVQTQILGHETDDIAVAKHAASGALQFQEYAHMDLEDTGIVKQVSEIALKHDPGNNADNQVPAHASVAVICHRNLDIPRLWRRLRAGLDLLSSSTTTAPVTLAPLPYRLQRVPDELRFFTSMLHYLAEPVGGDSYLYDVVTSPMLYNLDDDLVALLQSPLVYRSVCTSAEANDGGGSSWAKPSHLQQLLQSMAGRSDAELENIVRDNPSIFERMHNDDAAGLRAIEELQSTREKAQLVLGDIRALSAMQSRATMSELIAALIERVQQRCQPSTGGSAPCPTTAESLLVRCLDPKSASELRKATTLGHFVNALQRFEDSNSAAKTRASKVASASILASAEQHLPQLVAATMRSVTNVAATEARQAFEASVSSNSLTSSDQAASHHIHVDVVSPWDVAGQHWDYVFVPSVSRGRVPGRNMRGSLPVLDDVRFHVFGSMGNDGTHTQDADAELWWTNPLFLERERAKFLQCCTRARTQTVVSSSKSLGGKRSNIRPSVFIDEIVLGTRT